MINSIIPSYAFNEFKSELASATKKMKVDYEMTVGVKRVIHEYDDPNTPAGSFTNKIQIWGYDVEIVIPEIDKMTETGYTYLGCIKDDGLVTVHPNDNADFDLSSMEQIKTFPCDRCGKKASRNIIHVFRKDGEITVYGSTCAKTKFGIDVNMLVEKFSRLMLDFGGVWGDMEDNFGFARDWKFISAENFISMAYHEIVEHGYTSASKVYNEGGLSTTDCVSSDYFELINGNQTVIKGFEYNLDNIEFDFSEFVAWAGTFIASMDDNDFKFNMKGALEVIEEGYIHPRTKGFATYMVFKFWFDNKKASTEVKVEWNEDYSDLEEKFRMRDIRMEVINEYTFEGNYGTTHIYTFRGLDDNRKYKWFASKEIDTNGEMLVTGTVKGFDDHATYGKCVLITRCIVKEVE